MAPPTRESGSVLIDTGTACRCARTVCDYRDQSLQSKKGKSKQHVIFLFFWFPLTLGPVVCSFPFLSFSYNAVGNVFEIVLVCTSDVRELRKDLGQHLKCQSKDSLFEGFVHLS